MRAAAETFRANPGVDVATAITELKIGEALVSLLQADGSPTPVERTLIKPPASRVGPLDAKERGVMIATDAIGDKYDTLIDRQSAEEILLAKTSQAIAAAAEVKATTEAEKQAAVQAREQAKADTAAAKLAAQQAKEQARLDAAAAREAAKPTMMDNVLKSATRSASSSVGRAVANEVTKAVFGGRGRSSGGGIAGQLVRGILGGLFK